MNHSLLFDIIKETVFEIESEQREIHGKGIYFAPEQHIAYCIGKAVMKNKKTIFSENEKVEWLREKKLGEKQVGIGYGGVTDIVFKVADKIIAIELKLRDYGISYKADVDKLSKLPEDIDKYFCVLLDSFTENNDDRLINLQSEYEDKVHSVGHHAFPTWNNWYKKQVYCNLNLYSISSNHTEQQ